MQDIVGERRTALVRYLLTLLYFILHCMSRYVHTHTLAAFVCLLKGLLPYLLT